MRRNPNLASLSREHHVALERALQLTRADAADAEAALDAFAAFFAADGAAHFDVEERVLAPLLTDAERTRMLEDHAALRAAAEACAAGRTPCTAEAAHAIGARLSDHVRWEERRLFADLERRLGGAALDELGRQLETVA